MKEYKSRKDIPNEDKWDLTKIFNSDEDWHKEYDKLLEDINEISKFEGHILDNENTLEDYLNTDETLERRLCKVYYYAHLKHDEDTTNSKYQEFKGKADILLSKYSELTSYVSPEMMKKDLDYVKGLIDKNKNLEKYLFNFENFYRSKSHQLSYKEEKILSLLSNALSSSEESFESLTDSDLTFGKIKDENGKLVPFNESNYKKFIESTNRGVRKAAFKKLYKRYSEFKNTLASTFSGNVETLTKIAKIRKFNSSLESSLFSDNINTEIYHNLIDTIHHNLKPLYDYYDLKKEELGLDKLHLYDIYTPLNNDYNKEYSFEDAKNLAFKALEPLGEDYLNNFKKIFDEKWVDIYYNPGKRSGAYSSGFYDINPYILLNFEGRLDDVSTLVHEGGHSMHSYYSWHNNPYNTSSYKIFVAEVASTVNEMLLRLYLKDHSNSNEEKKYVLNEIMELFKGTIYRQTMFAEFERNMHALKEQGQVLNADTLCKNYYDLNKLYFGKNVYVDKEIMYEWERIPHFYYDFYVYMYAIGLSSAVKIANDIYNHKQGAISGYMKFLKSGGSNYPAEELKLAGVDVTSPKVIEDAIKVFDDAVKEYRKLMKKESE